MPMVGSLHADKTVKRRTWLWLVLAIVVAGGISALVYRETKTLAVQEAEDHVQCLLLEHKALHLYLQRDAIPALQKLKDVGELDQSFYSPEFLSSSYIVRNMHAYLNEVRKEAGQPAWYYKMASNNPRNPVNAADDLERRLIAMFDADRTVKQYRDVVEIDGTKYLYYAQPFLETNKSCLQCHGDPLDAPAELRRRYGDGGGFYSRLGSIRAIESIRVPIEGRLAAAQIIFLGLVLVGVAIAGLLLLNGRLRVMVHDRTRTLEAENAERRHAEHALRDSEGRVLAKNRQLEAEVQEREHAEERLRENVAKLERFNRLAVGRELRMKELKQEVNELLDALGQQPKYAGSDAAADTSSVSAPSNEGHEGDDT